MDSGDLVSAIPGWQQAMDRLAVLLEVRGEAAHARAKGYGRRYAGRRAVMVFDVVASRQRRYETRVQRLIEVFTATDSAASLEALASNPPAIPGLQAHEPATMAAVASGLLRYAADHHLDGEEAVLAWAQAADSFRHASKLEPYVGATQGMGTALFAYLRMRCGADAIKPDLRVRASLQGLGLAVPNDAHAILTLAEAAAEHVGLPRLVLDRTLWGVGEV